MEPGFDDVALATEVCDETWPETWSDDEYLDTPRCVCSCTITDVGCAP